MTICGGTLVCVRERLCDEEEVEELMFGTSEVAGRAEEPLSGVPGGRKEARDAEEAARFAKCACCAGAANCTCDTCESDCATAGV